MRNRGGSELAKIPLFQNLSAKQLAAVDALVTTIDVPSGRELMHQGEAGREFVVVVEGEAEVRRDGDVVATRGPGDFFDGQSTLLDHQHRGFEPKGFDRFCCRYPRFRSKNPGELPWT